MTEEPSNSPQSPEPPGPANADNQLSPHAHPGAPSWEEPPAGYGPAGSTHAAPGYGTRSTPHQVHAAPSFRSWQPGIIPLRPLNFGDFLAVPFRAMRYNRTVILGAPLLFTLASTALVLVAMWLVFTDSQLGLLNQVPVLSGISWTTVGMIVVSLLAVLLADVFSSSVIAPGVARAVLGERIKVSLAWKQVQRRLGSLLLLYLASAAALVLLLLITLAPMLATLTGGDQNPLVIVGSLLLFLVVMFPAGMVVTLLQGVTRAAIVLEGATIGPAFRRVLHLMRGRFWWSLLIVLVSSILINIVSWVLQNVSQIAFLGVGIVGPGNATALAVAFMVVYGLGYAVSMLLIYAYLGSIFSLLYIDMRMRREGFDLDLARAAEQRAAR